MDANERAEKIVAECVKQDPMGPNKFVHYKLTSDIAAAIREAEKEARASALEEAAKIAENDECGCGCDRYQGRVADKIRAIASGS